MSESEDPVIRTCSRCRTSKPLDQFVKAVRPRPSNLGYEGVCRACAQARAAGQTRRCKECRRVKTADAFRLRKDGHRENYCIECRNARARSGYHGERDTSLREARGALPDYETLKDLWVRQRKTQREIGQMYGVHADSVSRSLKERAQRRGEWPLLTREQTEARFRAGTERAKKPGEYRISRHVLADLLAEYLQESEMSTRQFALRNGLPPSYLYRLLGRATTTSETIMPAYAVRIMRAIGEEVPLELLRQSKLGLQPPPLPTSDKPAEEAAWTTGSAPDAEERVG